MGGHFILLLQDSRVYLYEESRIRRFDDGDQRGEAAGLHRVPDAPARVPSRKPTHFCRGLNNY